MRHNSDQNKQSVSRVTNMKKIFVLLGVLLVSLVLMVGCGENEWNPYEGQVKIVFDLNNGKYRGSSGPITMYYAFHESGEHLIKPLSKDTFDGEEVTRLEYVFDGWYTGTKDGKGNVTYDTLWNFEEDRVGADGITLYAKWKSPRNYAYELCYQDTDGSIKVIETTDAGGKKVQAVYNNVKEGVAFSDTFGYAQKATKPGYTFTGRYYTDAAFTEAWDLKTGHPGGDTDVTVRLFPEYIEGTHSIVSTPAELVTAMKNNANGSVIIMNDIDFSDYRASATDTDAGVLKENFGTFTGTMKPYRGGSFAIKNFKLHLESADLIRDEELSGSTTDQLLCFSLFDSLSGATIENVSFTDYRIVLFNTVSKTRMILTAPLAMKMSNSTLTNVTVSGTYVYDMSDKDKAKVIVEEDSVAYYADAGKPSTLTGVTVSFTAGT